VEVDYSDEEGGTLEEEDDTLEEEGDASDEEDSCSSEDSSSDGDGLPDVVPYRSTVIVRIVHTRIFLRLVIPGVIRRGYVILWIAALLVS
jgi:hypothetical protein